MKKTKISLAIVIVLLITNLVFASEQRGFNRSLITTVRMGLAGSNLNSGYVSLLIQGNYYNIRPPSATYDTLSKLISDIRGASYILLRFDDTTISNEKNVTNFWVDYSR